MNSALFCMANAATVLRLKELTQTDEAKPAKHKAIISEADMTTQRILMGPVVARASS